MEQFQIPNNAAFQFSAVKPDDLTETEYTLVTLVVDKTGSVTNFAHELLEMQKAALGSCKKSPRANNLLVRVLHFNEKTEEVHGFKPLSDIDIASYNSIRPMGGTALFDATFNAVAATQQYASMLVDQDYSVNAVTYVITDGDDNSSRSASPHKIAQKLEEVVKTEKLESYTTILVGINASLCKTYLDRFSKDANLTAFVDMGDVTEGKLAKLAGYVSKSISSTSQSLGSGKAASVSLTI